jgi:hypothetical protein
MSSANARQVVESQLFQPVGELGPDEHFAALE